MCMSKGLYKERECFLLSKYLEIPIMEIDEDTGKIVMDNKEMELEEVDRDGFFDMIAELHYYFPDIPVTTFVMSYYGGLCPQSLLTAEGAALLSLENAVSRYHTLPFPGSYLEQPLTMIEAFEVIRSTIIDFENRQMREITESQK